MKVPAICAALSILTAVSASAGYFDTDSNKYYGMCHSQPQTVVCVATASAFYDMLQAQGYLCTKDRGDITRLQVTDVLLKYLRDHPEDRGDPLSDLAVRAFQQMLGCRKGS
ncbi:hypothetical protein [Bradyrhizobium sp. USDA 4452]